MNIAIGHDGANPVAFDLDLLITTRLLIQANSGAGKSYLLRKLMEQLFGHVQIIAIDPEGEFASLREKYAFVLVGPGGETPADIRSAEIVAHRLLELRASAICDLYEMKPAQRHTWVQRFLDALVDAPKNLWHPLVVIVDEAHLFCPEKGAGESVASEAMISLSTRGRKRGFCAVWATQRLSKLRKDATAELLNRLVGGTFEDLDIKRALDLLGVAPDEKHAMAQKLKTLTPGFFYAFGRAISKERVLLKVDRALTTHAQPGSGKHAGGPPPAPEKIRALLPKLADLPKEAEDKLATEQQLRQRIRELEVKVRDLGKNVPQVDEEALREQVMSGVLKACKARDEQWMHAVKGYQVETAENADDISRRMLAMVGTPFLPPLPLDVNIDLQYEEPPRKPPVKERVGADASVNASVGADAPVRSTAAKAAANGITGPQNRILDALALFESLDRTSVPKKWIAAIAGASHSSSTFGNNLGALRSAGLIEYPAAGHAGLTAEGRSATPSYERPDSPEAMFFRCSAIVSKPQAAILRKLFEVYPRSLEIVQAVHRRTPLRLIQSAQRACPIKTSREFASGHKSTVQIMAKGYLQCGNCGKQLQLTAEKVEGYLREGWPECCAGTLEGGTMGFYR